jgi:hypothetical protein
MQICLFSCLLFGLLVSTTDASPANGSHSPVQNWLYTSQIDNETLHLLDRPDILGVQALYFWKSIEPQKGQYDFSAIQQDLELVQARGKQLWVQVMDRSFTVQNNPVPPYLHTPHYNNGSVAESSGCGWVAAQWNEYVRERFQCLLKALSDSFDGCIYGMNLPETSLCDILPPYENYTDQDYFHAELENAKYAASVFRKSYAVQYVNFWNGPPNNTFMADSFAFYAKHGVGIGGPDDLPYKPYQEQNSYPYLWEYHDKVPITVIAVQEPDLAYLNPNTSKPFTKQEFTAFAVNQLGAKIMFWALSSPWLHE